MFDLLVLTASNEGQARAYRAELGARGLSEHSTPRVMVVPDPGGARVGSGVSTLLVLAEVARDLRERKPGVGSLAALFAGRRICVIHCGGDSRRLPAYAAHGKIFAPLPLKRPGPAALFDLIADDLARIPLPDQGRVIVATGDVFLDVGAHPLGFERPGIVGVAWPDTPERGARHGVYIADQHDDIAGFLHKPTAEQAHGLGAIRDDGSVLIDTGVISLDADTAAHWLGQAGASLDADGGLAIDPEGILGRAIATGEPAIDLYGEILPAMAHREPAHRTDWRGELPFHAAIVPSSPFLHIGSSRELLDTLTGPPPTVGWTTADDGTRVFNSVLKHQPRALGQRVVVEGCHLAHPPTLPGSNIVVGVPRELDAPIDLPEGWGLVCLPTDAGWAGVLFGDADDFKTPHTRGGTIGNQPLDRWLESAALDPDDIWPDTDEPDRSLWTARLWTTGPAAKMLDTIGWIASGDAPPDAWCRAPRLSAADVMARVDHRLLLATRRQVLGDA